jgi:hypothetical protein
MNVQALSPAQVLLAAQQVGQQAKTPMAHWSTTAALLRRIDLEQLYTMSDPPRPDLLTFAHEVMGLGTHDFMEALRLADVIAAEPSLPPETWLKLSKSRALIVAKAKALGGDVAQWIAKALQAPTTEALRVEYQHAAGEEPWLTYKIRLPGSLAELTRDLFIVAAAEIDPSIPSEAVESPKVAFRCWERILQVYATHEHAKDLAAAKEEL